jgi:hypothetical protein
MIVVLPALSAVTSPVPDTDAIVGLDDDHVTVRPVSTLLAASRVIAVA